MPATAARRLTDLRGERIRVEGGSSGGVRPASGDVAERERQSHLSSSRTLALRSPRRELWVQNRQNVFGGSVTYSGAAAALTVVLRRATTGFTVALAMTGMPARKAAMVVLGFGWGGSARRSARCDGWGWALRGEDDVAYARRAR